MSSAFEQYQERLTARLREQQEQRAAAEQERARCAALIERLREPLQEILDTHPVLSLPMMTGPNQYGDYRPRAIVTQEGTCLAIAVEERSHSGQPEQGYLPRVMIRPMPYRTQVDQPYIWVVGNPHRERPIWRSEREVLTDFALWFADHTKLPPV